MINQELPDRFQVSLGFRNQARRSGMVFLDRFEDGDGLLAGINFPGGVRKYLLFAPELPQTDLQDTFRR